MAYINGNRRISPLDINKNVTIGVAFPLDDVNLFKGTQTVKEQVKSNLINLLLTEPGERINEPSFGVGLKNLLFEQNPDIEILKEKINTQIEYYIPLISLSDINVNFENDKYLLYIIISYNFNLDGSTDAIQLNFNSSYFPRGNG
jgi:phage baseplate assembly protein W